MADPVVQLTHLWWPPAFCTSLWRLVQRTSLLFPTSFEPTGTPRSFFKVQWRDRNWIGQTQSANEQPISHRVLGIAIQNKSVQIANLLENSFFLWTLGILNGTAISSGRFLVYFCLFTQCFGLIPSSCSFSLQHVFGLNTERIPSSNEHVSCSNQTCIRSILYTFNSKTRPFSFIFCSQRIAFLSSCFVALLFTLLIILFSNFLLLEKSHCALLFIRHNQELYIYYSHTTSLL